MSDELAHICVDTCVRWLHSGLHGANEPSRRSYSLFATVAAGQLAHTHADTLLLVSEVMEIRANGINEETTELVSKPPKNCPSVEHCGFKQNGEEGEQDEHARAFQHNRPRGQNSELWKIQCFEKCYEDLNHTQC